MRSGESPLEAEQSSDHYAPTPVTMRLLVKLDLGLACIPRSQILKSRSDPADGVARIPTIRQRTVAATCYDYGNVNYMCMSSNLITCYLD